MAAVGLVIPKAAPVVIAGLGSLAVFVKKKIGKGKKRGDDVRAEDEARTRRREVDADTLAELKACLLYTSPSPRDATLSRMPSSA